mmetsp:Transcript_102420/g.181890  ORF Transcript_102420/g.181890 Transcript_102420/m.181890 type:complete len:89 (+) Transcript_102420:102-368(+)
MAIATCNLALECILGPGATLGFTGAARCGSPKATAWRGALLRSAQRMESSWAQLAEKENDAMATAQFDARPNTRRQRHRSLRRHLATA